MPIKRSLPRSIMRTGYMQTINSPPARAYYGSKLKRLVSKIGSPVRLHLGCGPRYLEGWINVDILPQKPMPDVLLDLTRDLPLPDACVDYMFSETMIDTMGLEKTQHFISECYRCLKPGGMFRLLAGDLHSFVMAYLNRSQRDFDWYQKNFACKSYAEMLQLGLHTIGGNEFIFDEELLTQILQSAGLKVERSNFNASKNPMFHNIELRNNEVDGSHTMYFDCTKPER